MAAYSFKDVKATILGVGGAIVMGSDAGVDDEGITIDRVGDKNTMTTGADGAVMHSLHAENSGTVTVRLLKTSPINQQLQEMYDLQRISSEVWGQNLIVVSDIVRGDMGECNQVAFKKFPNEKWSKDGAMLEWTFDAGDIDQILGAGTFNLTL